MTTSTPIIGFDAKRIVSNGTGLGSYGRTLINDLARFPLTLRLYAPTPGRDDLRSQITDRENISFVYPHSPSHLLSPLWRSHFVVSDLKRDNVQLYHGLSGELPIGIRKSGIKSVVTIHDLIFLRHPEFYNPIDVKLYTWKFRRTLREADHIIAISECTKRDILEYGAGLITEDKITLIYQSCSPRFTSSPFTSSPSPHCHLEPSPHCHLEPSPHCHLERSREISSPYILSVGSIEPRKNTLLALKALHYLPSDISLVLVGRHTKYTDTLLAYAKEHQLDHRYEGFGIPIIEAISCGLPVVACTGSCLEEAGGPDSLYVAPDDALGMADAIRRSLKGAEGREERIQHSMDYIRRFSGTDVAAQVVEVYKKVLGGY